MDDKKVSLEKRVLWTRWDRIVNMTPQEVRSFRESDDGKSVGWNKEEAQHESIDGTPGQDASKKIEVMIKKASKFRKQSKKVPNWTPEEWALASTQVAFISRARSNVGELQDEEDNLTPKAKALKLWGRDELRSNGKFPDKDKIKKEIATESHIEDANSLLLF